MKFLQSIVRDARRPIGAVPAGIQRSELDGAELESTIAPPIEEQDNGASTIYRFQKEGAPGSREVSGGGRGSRSDSGATPSSPFTPGGGEILSPSVTQQSKEIFSVKGNVHESIASRQSDLATGKAHDSVERSLFESESTGPGEVSLSQRGHEFASVSSVTGPRSEHAMQQSSPTFEHGVEQRFFRWTPGDDAPSETHSQAAPNAGSKSVRQQPPHRDADMTTNGSMALHLGDEATPEHYPPHGQTMLHKGLAQHAADIPLAQPDALPEQNGKVYIGQVDVVVISEGPRSAPAADADKAFLSRNYLRRL